MAKAKKAVDTRTRLEKAKNLDPQFAAFAIRVFDLTKGSLTNCENPEEWVNYQRWEVAEDTSNIDRNTRLVGNKEHVGGTRCSSWDLDSGENDSEGYSVEEANPNLDVLDDVLAGICPDIKFLQYKKLLKEADAKTESTSENEYYGNSSNYMQKYVVLGFLYDALVRMGLYTPPPVLTPEDIA